MSTKGWPAVAVVAAGLALTGCAASGGAGTGEEGSNEAETTRSYAKATRAFSFEFDR